MSRRLNAALLAVACCLPFGGCGKNNNDNAPPADQILLGASVDAVVREVNDFTGELERAFESAQNPQAGVAEAQKLLDARRPTLAARIAAVKGGPQLQRDASAKREWLEAEVDNTNRVHAPGSKFVDASMRDPAFKARLDKLVSDYDAMFKDSAGH